MTLLVGFLTGTLMALAFAAHMSMMFAFNPPAIVRNADPERNNLAGMVLGLHVAALLTWPAVGIASALAFSVAERELASDIPGIPSAVYTAAVLVVVLAMAPPLLLLGRGRLRHLLAEFGLFFGLFGLAIPLLVVAAGD